MHSVQSGRAMPAKFLSSRVMVTVVVAFLAACEARHGNFMPTFLRDVIRLAAFSALVNSMTTGRSVVGRP